MGRLVHKISFLKNWSKNSEEKIYRQWRCVFSARKKSVVIGDHSFLRRKSLSSLATIHFCTEKAYRQWRQTFSMQKKPIADSDKPFLLKENTKINR
ncbi:MAG: hypothetical protein ACK5LR_09735 [Mangrovibacterium sp.]